MFRDWWGRLVSYSTAKASTAAWPSASDGNGSHTSSSSSCRVWWNRSTLPVVVGERGLVSR